MVYEKQSKFIRCWWSTPYSSNFDYGWNRRYQHLLHFVARVSRREQRDFRLFSYLFVFSDVKISMVKSITMASTMFPQHASTLVLLAIQPHPYRVPIWQHKRRLDLNTAVWKSKPRFQPAIGCGLVSTH